MLLYQIYLQRVLHWAVYPYIYIYIAWPLSSHTFHLTSILYCVDCGMHGWFESNSCLKTFVRLLTAMLLLSWKTTTATRIIMYIYRALISALNGHIIRINLNIFCTHVEHSAIKNNLHKVLYGNTHTDATNKQTYLVLWDLQNKTQNKSKG